MYNLRFLQMLYKLWWFQVHPLSDVLQPRQSYVMVIVHNNHVIYSNFILFLSLRINRSPHFHYFIFIIVDTTMIIAI